MNSTISLSRFRGRSHWIGVLFLSCLALFLISACASPKVLENRTIERVKPPAGMLVCAPAPEVPTTDRLASDDGDNALAAYWARVEYARRDCWCAVEELRAFVDETQAPADCNDALKKETTP